MGFILAFLTMAGLRSAGLLPEAAVHPMAATANALTIVSMAALGLGVDVRSVVKAGPRVTLAVVRSLAALTAVSLGLIRLLGIADGSPPLAASRRVEPNRLREETPDVELG